MRTRQNIAKWWNALTWRERAHILGHRFRPGHTRMPTFDNLDAEQTLIVVRYAAQEVTPSCRKAIQPAPNPSELSAAG